MTPTRAPRRLGDDARRTLYLVMNEARDAADHAAAHASVADIPGLLTELRRTISCSLSAINTLQSLADAEERDDARRAA